MKNKEIEYKISIEKPKNQEGDNVEINGTIPDLMFALCKIIILLNEKRNEQRYDTLFG